MQAYGRPKRGASHEDGDIVRTMLEMACCVHRYTGDKLRYHQHQLNSLYGALGNEHFKYGEVANAEAITLFGQVVNKRTQIYVNDVLNDIQGTKDRDNICGGDTDSIYIVLELIAELLFNDDDDIQLKIDKLDMFSKEIISPELQKATDDIAEYMNSKANKMVWEREAIASAMVYVAKKNYAMDVWDNEGVRHYGAPKIKIRGLEAIKSSTPKWSRDNLMTCYKTALSGEEKEIQELAKGFFEEFDKINIEETAQIISVNNIEKYYIDGVFQPKAQRQVRAAVNYNNLLKEHGIEYTGEIQNGEKIKILPLKMPNPSGLDVIGFTDRLPEVFNLHGYIDKAKVYEDAFKKPARRFLDVMGWSMEARVSLEEYFS